MNEYRMTFYLNDNTTAVADTDEQGVKAAEEFVCAETPKIWLRMQSPKGWTSVRIADIKCFDVEKL